MHLSIPITEILLMDCLEKLVQEIQKKKKTEMNISIS